MKCTYTNQGLINTVNNTNKKQNLRNGLKSQIFRDLDYPLQLMGIGGKKVLLKNIHLEEQETTTIRKRLAATFSLPFYKLKASILHLEVHIQGSHLNIGLGIWVIVTVLSAGTRITHLSTKFLEYLENSSLPFHFTPRLFGGWDCLWLAPTAVLELAYFSLWEPIVHNSSQIRIQCYHIGTCFWLESWWESLHPWNRQMLQIMDIFFPQS